MSRPTFAPPSFLADEEGATAIEYALIGTLIALAIMASVYFFSSRASAMWNTIANHMT